MRQRCVNRIIWLHETSDVRLIDWVKGRIHCEFFLSGHFMKYSFRVISWNMKCFHEILLLQYPTFIAWCFSSIKKNFNGKDTLWNFSFRGFHEIQFQGHFMKHEILSWNTFTLVSNIHCVCFSSIKNCVYREMITCKI